MCYCHLIILWHFYYYLVSVLGKSWRILYFFTNSSILQKTQFASYPSPLLCYATVVLILDPWLRVSFSNYVLRKVSPKQHMFTSCRGQWNVTMVLPSIRVNLRTAHFSEFWHSLAPRTKEQLNYPRILFSTIYVYSQRGILHYMNVFWLKFLPGNVFCMHKVKIYVDKWLWLKPQETKYMCSWCSVRTHNRSLVNIQPQSKDW